MFENKYANLPDEPPPPLPPPPPPTTTTTATNLEIDPSLSVGAVRNNGPLPPTARPRNRKSSKNFSNVGVISQQSSMITSSDEGGSTDESSGDDMQMTDENTLRQLRVLQDQVIFL